MKSVKEIYQSNEQFKEYIEKYLKKNDCTLEDALKKAIIKEVAYSYEPGGINHKRG